MAHGAEPWGRLVNPDVVRAISRLQADNILSAAQAALFDRVARRGLVSVRFEIRALLYAGVLLLTSGVGVLVAEHRQEIGPLALATALLPLVVLAWGLRSRRAFILDTGIVLLALSLVTLRHYVHVAPLWVVLALSGALLIVLALAVERALRRAPAGEVAGFTADPLFSDERRQQVLQVVPVVTAFTPPTATRTQGPGFTAEGGRFGGGGAQEKF
jgi:hypothetical protein